jgi:predicted HicB family RNase H-like nuclease
MTVVVPEAELRLWKVAAARRGVSLAEWVRRVLSATAAAVEEEAK